MRPLPTEDLGGGISGHRDRILRVEGDTSGPIAHDNPVALSCSRHRECDGREVQAVEVERWGDPEYRPFRDALRSDRETVTSLRRPPNRARRHVGHGYGQGV